MVPIPVYFCSIRTASERLDTIDKEVNTTETMPSRLKMCSRHQGNTVPQSKKISTLTAVG